MTIVAFAPIREGALFSTDLLFDNRPRQSELFEDSLLCKLERPFGIGRRSGAYTLALPGRLVVDVLPRFVQVLPSSASARKLDSSKKQFLPPPSRLVSRWRGTYLLARVDGGRIASIDALQWLLGRDCNLALLFARFAPDW